MLKVDLFFSGNKKEKKILFVVEYEKSFLLSSLFIFGQSFFSYDNIFIVVVVVTMAADKKVVRL
jgi:hypothetical protein